MKRSKSISILTILLMVAGSLLTLFAAGCVVWNTSTKAVDLAQASPGQTITYTINVVNTGDEISKSTVVTDQVNQNLENIGNISAGGSFNSGTKANNAITIGETEIGKAIKKWDMRRS